MQGTDVRKNQEPILRFPPRRGNNGRAYAREGLGQYLSRLSRNLAGEVKLDFAPSGLVCHITAALDEVAATRDMDASHHSNGGSG